MEAVLGSWKEIAVYLNRGVRTTQRWELQKSLPVRRVGRGNKAPVFAFRTEIHDWLRAQTTQGAIRHVERSGIPARVHLNQVALERQRELRLRMCRLIAAQIQKRAEVKETLRQIIAMHPKSAPGFGSILAFGYRI